MAGIAPPPAAVSEWEMASVSMMLAPSSPNSVATADLPLPIPPVSPTENFLNFSVIVTLLWGELSVRRKPTIDDGLADQEGEQAGGG